MKAEISAQKWRFAVGKGIPPRNRIKAFLRHKWCRSKQFWESFKILSWIRDTKLDKDIGTRSKSWSTPGATVVGTIYGYPTVLPRFRQARVAHRGGGGT